MKAENLYQQAQNKLKSQDFQSAIEYYNRALA